jgi:hypothetical protein
MSSIHFVSGFPRWRGISMMGILFFSIGNKVFIDCLSWGISSKLCILNFLVELTSQYNDGFFNGDEMNMHVNVN